MGISGKLIGQLDDLVHVVAIDRIRDDTLFVLILCCSAGRGERDMATFYQHILRPESMDGGCKSLHVVDALDLNPRLTSNFEHEPGFRNVWSHDVTERQKLLADGADCIPSQ